MTSHCSVKRITSLGDKRRVEGWLHRSERASQGARYSGQENKTPRGVGGGSSRLRAEVRAAFTAGKADESEGQKQEPVRGGEAGLLHPQTRKLPGGWGGTGPPRRQRVHHRTFSPRPPPSCRSASSSPRSSCICPPLAERSRARAARGSPLVTILSAGGRPAPGPKPSPAFGSPALNKHGRLGAVWVRAPHLGG